jgi:membrane protein DedA with SNARE-associated domain
MDGMALVDPLLTSPLLYPLLATMTSLDGVLPMIPSEAAVLASGVFAHGSTRGLLFVVVATALGVFAGDHLAYGLSRSVFGPRLVGRFRHVARAVAAARRQLDHQPALLIVTSRFVPGGRVTMNAACGTARVPLARFSPASAVAALAWATYTAGLGFVGGAAFVENPLLGLAVGLGLSFALGGLIELVRRRTRRATPRLDRHDAANDADLHQTQKAEVRGCTAAGIRTWRSSTSSSTSGSSATPRAAATVPPSSRRPPVAC